MSRTQRTAALLRNAFVPGIALVALLAIAGYALVGPTGVLAWGDYRAALHQQQVQLAELKAQRAALKNQVALLDPRGVDPDLASELIRKNLNVVHPDEVVVILK